jgi:uncharacterized membrane protein
MIVWVVLLACIVLFMYAWSSGTFKAKPAAQCNTCPGKKNVQPGE